MADEAVEYLLPEDRSEWWATLKPWIEAYQKQDKINLTKLFGIINSILDNGILNQRDRLHKLSGNTKASTSTDSPQGSENIHGMMLNQPRDKTQSAQTAEKESVNVLSEVKDDVLFGVVRKRLSQHLYTQEERAHVLSILKSQKGAEFYKLVLSDKYDLLVKKLSSLAKEEGLIEVDLGSDYLRKEIKEFSLRKIADSKRGWNEMHKRIMSGFLTVFDVDKIDEKDWTTKPSTGETSEGVLKASQPASKMLKMILPKYLEHYQDRIINPHHVPIIFQSIDYPVRGEVHVYFPNGDRATFKNEIDLKWSQEILNSLLEHERIFTHMVRGF
jgi:hypothetical protein